MQLEKSKRYLIKSTLGSDISEIKVKDILNNKYLNIKFKRECSFWIDIDTFNSEYNVIDSIDHIESHSFRDGLSGVGHIIEDLQKSAYCSKDQAFELKRLGLYQHYTCDHYHESGELYHITEMHDCKGEIATAYKFEELNSVFIHNSSIKNTYNLSNIFIKMLKSDIGLLKDANSRLRAYLTTK